MKNKIMKVTTGNKTIDQFIFQSVNDKIKQSIVHYSPSRSNGRLDIWLTAVKAIFAAENINEEAYWQHVLDKKSPQKQIKSGVEASNLMPVPVGIDIVE